MAGWHKGLVHSLSLKAQDRETWKKTIWNALDTYDFVPMDLDDDDDDYGYESVTQSDCN